MTEKTKEQLREQILRENADFMYRVHPEYYATGNGNYVKKDFSKKVSDWQYGLSDEQIPIACAFLAACVIIPLFALMWWFH
jgi:hypothetical protein